MSTNKILSNDQIKEMILAARGDLAPDLVLKNARIVNVFTKEIESGDVAIKDGYIVGIGEFNGEEEIDIGGRIICPGLIDGHIHIESSMISPSEFAGAVAPHGTTAVIADPHEIANVAGEEGIRYMLEASAGLPVDIFFMLPSCVPATPLDESGAELSADELEPFYKEERVAGLAELMNSFGTVRADEEIIRKIQGANSYGKRIDGHAPFLTGKDLNAYITAGVRSDHECSSAEEAIEKLKLGQYIMIRDIGCIHFCDITVWLLTKIRKVCLLTVLVPLIGIDALASCIFVCDSHAANTCKKINECKIILSDFCFFLTAGKLHNCRCNCFLHRFIIMI